MDTGSWEIKINFNGMPQKVATAFSKLTETMVGAEYEPIAYLGSQVVNGVNHAVLAKQIIVTGRDTENIVVLIFNEKPNSMEATLVSIERVVEGGLPMGGISLDIQTELSAGVRSVWDNAMVGYVGAQVEPVVFLGTQVVNGINYIFVATCKAMSPEGVTELRLVTINTLEHQVCFSDLLSNKQSNALKYAFNW